MIMMIIIIIIIIIVVVVVVVVVVAAVLHPERGRALVAGEDARVAGVEP